MARSSFGNARDAGQTSWNRGVADRPGKRAALALNLILIVLGVAVFGRDAGSGPNQISLVFATALAIAMAVFVGKVPWAVLEEGISRPCAASSRSSAAAIAFAAWGLANKNISKPFLHSVSGGGGVIYIMWGRGRGKCVLRRLARIMLTGTMRRQTWPRFHHGNKTTTRLLPPYGGTADGLPGG